MSSNLRGKLECALTEGTPRRALRTTGLERHVSRCASTTYMDVLSGREDRRSKRVSFEAHHLMDQWAGESFVLPQSLPKTSGCGVADLCRTVWLICQRSPQENAAKLPLSVREPHNRSSSSCLRLVSTGFLLVYNIFPCSPVLSAWLLIPPTSNQYKKTRT